ncbi:hypothetical protein EVAR_59727_1 [Eumeta japonica]|uniref:Uncharacterized protein n=1 Tax=Eumeta variegata TaxID=151549 RepID=A0A4C1XIC6_EUMVA|nr:hypothetical protein EVAR_59727_1 [Eumeta japonica]
MQPVVPIRRSFLINYFNRQKRSAESPAPRNYFFYGLLRRARLSSALMIYRSGRDYRNRFIVIHHAAAEININCIITVTNGKPESYLGHMPVCFDHTAHSIDVFVVHSSGSATVTKFVTETDTTVFEFCKLLLDRALAGCGLGLMPPVEKFNVYYNYPTECRSCIFLVSESYGCPTSPSSLHNFPTSTFPSSPSAHCFFHQIPYSYLRGQQRTIGSSGVASVHGRR